MLSSRVEVTGVCGLDIGSNTLSCAEIARGDSGAGITVLRDKSLVTRLSEGLRPGGQLQHAAVVRSLSTLEDLAQEFDLANRPLRAVGTRALRMTADPSPFIAPAEELLGAEIEIIDGKEEALLVSRGAVADLAASGQQIVADVGGQSTEICWQEANKNWQPLSIPVGVVTLTEAFLRSDPPALDEIEALRKAAHEAIAGAVPRGLSGRLVAAAGTATTLAMLDLGIVNWDRDQVHGLELNRSQLEGWLARMLELDIASRTARYRVRPGRADVFPAGLSLLVELLEHLECDRFTVSAGGLRIGAALSLLEDI